MIGTHLQAVENHLVAMNMLKYSNENYVYIQLRELLCYELHRYGIKRYYVSDTLTMVDSIFASNYIGIAMNKGFKYQDQFNDMYVDNN